AQALLAQAPARRRTIRSTRPQVRGGAGRVHNHNLPDLLSRVVLGTTTVLVWLSRVKLRSLGWPLSPTPVTVSPSPTTLTTPGAVRMSLSGTKVASGVLNTKLP